MRLTFLGLLFISLLGTAQNEIWNKLLVNESARADFAVTKMVIDKFNNKYIINVVEKTESTTDSTTFYLIKYDEFDKLIWTKKILKAASLLPVPFIVTYDSKENLFLGINFTKEIFVEDSIYVSAGNIDALVIKTDLDGSVLFTKQFGGVCIDGIREIVLDENGNIYLSGQFGYDRADTDLNCNLQFEDKLFVTDNYSNGNYFIIKLNTYGQLLWQHTGGGNGFDALYHLDIKKDNLYFAGSSSSISKMNLNNYDLNLPKSFNYNIFVAKANANTGKVLWAKYAGTSGALNYVSSIELKSSGSTISLLGTISTGETGKGNHLVIKGAEPLIWEGFGDSDYFLINYDTLGNVNWTRQGLHTGRDNVEDLIIDSKNNHYIAGYGNGNFIFNNETIATQGSNDIFIACYNYKGEEKWIKTAGGRGNDTANSLALDKRGRIYVCGGTASHPTTFGDITIEPPHPNNLYLARLSSDTIIGINPIEISTTQTTIYPNPAINSISIKQTGNQQAVKNVVVYDIQGNAVLQNRAMNKQSIDVQFLPSGIYFLNILYKNGKQQMLKLCKQ